MRPYILDDFGQGVDGGTFVAQPAPPGSTGIESVGLGVDGAVTYAGETLELIPPTNTSLVNYAQFGWHGDSAGPVRGAQVVFKVVPRSAYVDARLNIACGVGVRVFLQVNLDASGMTLAEFGYDAGAGPVTTSLPLLPVTHGGWMRATLFPDGLCWFGYLNGSALIEQAGPPVEGDLSAIDVLTGPGLHALPPADALVYIDSALLWLDAGYPATRAFPRDDGRGIDGNSRIHPPPKSRRIVGGHL